MRIDVVTIFPEYLAPLDLSLIGKAREDGLLTVTAHDLRDFTHDRHRTVDDTPYGGGAGMVMKPQPWAEALDHVVAQGDGSGGRRPRLVVPGPGGAPFTQSLARELAEEPWLAFACGRYEGIDERVYEYARDDLGLEVSVVSLGDYVLNGGEVAVLAMVEAIARLLPGVIGNAESLVEESHEDGLLEYPIYTKPKVWNGRSVPDVLLSGNHSAIAAWRHEQRLARTASRRPDLLHPAQVTTDGDLEVDLRPAVPADVPELFTLTKACWVQEAVANDRLDIPPLHESIEELRASLDETRTWVARSGGRLVGSVRTSVRGDDLFISRLMVAPDLQGLGLGRRLLALAEEAASSGTRSFSLLAGALSADNLRMYRKAGYRPVPGEPPAPGAVELVKRRRG
ncbi:tRNA (guanosine(37)-N1)-methyltransferase TrmD [Intrasporangium calvum]|uniref:tRNA (guanine-N(1)-)-methyltransferase n=1 Tax=Intrasporangium calvum TaxID=53358 RepID=A0ABT5GM02_9MICO|nr:tRNA (guanosine(37)-N1)-methyltransferase TrmD [Intrasporangium calvum]MDC5699278.1 tRNA (guanosine(37)-N1)-methyltransferase TrmD [Intrasporangium calvum]